MESFAARERRALGNLEKVMRFRTATIRSIESLPLHGKSQWPKTYALRGAALRTYTERPTAFGSYLGGLTWHMGVTRIAQNRARKRIRKEKKLIACQANY
jgi:hypothetical protein